MPRTIATTVAPRALRSIRSGHPWVFDHSIRSQKPQPSVGDLAVVFDDRRRFVGIGLADPGNPIAIRILHHGSSATIDGGFFAERVDAALDDRSALLSEPTTTGLRLINGENDQLPGLIADQYDGVIVLKIYTAAWLPHLTGVLDRLVDRRRPDAVVLRASRAVQPELPNGDGEVIFGELPHHIVSFVENGLRFNADVLEGNKTGHFLDQRDNRQRVRELAEGCSVLDVFSSTGGFSVYAAAGGARSVTAIDVSPGALKSAVQNIADNGPGNNFTAVQGDAFDQMGRLESNGERFDIVVVDPPSFASKKADIERALGAYRRLTRTAVPLVAPGGLLVQASCSGRVTEESFQNTIDAELNRVGFGERTWHGHPVDHPVRFPEGRYLKAVFARR